MIYLLKFMNQKLDKLYHGLEKKFTLVKDMNNLIFKVIIEYSL